MKSGAMQEGQPVIYNKTLYILYYSFNGAFGNPFNSVES
jgi:hypothetical protein